MSLILKSNSEFSGNIADLPFISLLDEYTPMLACGLRRLISSYTGALIQVMRSSDSTTLDISADPSGELDTASLLNFVGNGDGFVSKLYDQSGNNFYFYKGAGFQPKIVASGSLITEGGYPAMSFAGGNTGIRLDMVASGFSIIQNIKGADVSVVSKALGTNNGGAIFKVTNAAGTTAFSIGSNHAPK